ncbi:MAG: hypothetical protein ABIZ64_17690 [Casimicrobium sp.]|jgi:hypothetical protein
MQLPQFNAKTILSPVYPVRSSRGFGLPVLLTSTISAIAPIALISLLLRSQRK